MEHSMNKKLFLAVLLAAAGILPAAAQTSEADHAAHHPTAAAPAADLTSGEVRRIDKAGGKVTLKHGEIKNLDMPGMTMVFQVRDVALLDAVKVGDKVRFHVEKQGSAFVVTDMQLTQ
jgi:Cu(I)/Ag(I) efflux system protein CusF